jgi:hypothetical protein
MKTRNGLFRTEALGEGTGNDISAVVTRHGKEGITLRDIHVEELTRGAAVTPHDPGVVFLVEAFAKLHGLLNQAHVVARGSKCSGKVVADFAGAHDDDLHNRSC